MSNNNEEPSEGNTKESYDYIILGTGLIESIISCSLAKYGKKVLHLDANDTYGEIFLSSNLSSTMKYLHSLGNNEDEARNTPHYASENNGFMKLDEKSSNFLLIPESNELQRQINLKQLQLLEIYQRDLNRFYPSSKRSSSLHPAYYHLLTKPPGTPPPPQTTSNEKKAEFLHPAYFPLITNEEEEQFLGLFLHSDRYFNIDLSPKMVYCSGKLINSIIQSKIHHYLEFKPMNSFYYFLSASLSSPAAAASSSAYQLWKVPSNKNDIFLSTHLTAIEKRCLMKFYQYIFDWSQLQKGKNLFLFNENELKTGRALYRPQNKSVAAGEGMTTKPEEDGLTSSPAPSSSSSNEKKKEEEDSAEKGGDILYNQQNFKEKSFLEFLQAFKLSEKLQSIIIYALCLHYSSAERGERGRGRGEAAVIDSAVFDAVLSKSIHETLQDLSLYFNSVGIFGETAFLAPLYGISETVQGFCRMSAVWGSTFMLRRSLSLIRTISQENIDPVTKDEKKQPEESDLKDAEVSTKGEEEKESSSSVKPADIIIGKLLEVKDNEGNEYTCKKIISNFRYLPSIVNCAPYFSYHGVMLLAPSSSSIAVASLFPEERTVGIIPPHFSYSGEDGQIHALENEYTVYLHQYDKSTEATAEGMTVLHIHTLISDQSIERDRRLIHWEQRANEQFPRCQRLTEHLEKIVKLKEQMKFIDWKPVANSTETVVKDATTTTATTILPFSIVFSRAFLRPIAEHLWQNHPSDENLLITGSFNYSSLHLEEEVETAKRVVYELLERGEIKSTRKAWGEFELFEEEKTAAAANEEDQEDGEDGDETNSRPLPSSTGMEESEEATDANEYMQIYQKILASSSGSGGVEAPNTLNSSDNNPEPANHNHDNNKNED